MISRLVAVLACASTVFAAAQAPTPQDLARVCDSEHVSPPVSALVDHADVARRIGVLNDHAAGVLHVRELGASLEGRKIWDVSFGTGPYVVLLVADARRRAHGDVSPV
jgi:hypothetical protein